jgi:hypothetical protein
MQDSSSQNINLIKTITEGINDDKFYYSQDVMMNHKKVEES